MWSRRLAELVNRHGKGNIRAIPVSIDLFSFFNNILFIIKAECLVRVGFRPGVFRPNGILFDVLWLIVVALNSNARVFYYWTGSDVMKATEDYHGSTSFLSRWFFARSKKVLHIAAAPRLADELKLIGLPAKNVLFPSHTLSPSRPPPFLDKFAILSYIPDKRYQFYGGEEIYQAAKALPKITFHIVAGEGSWVKVPLPNLLFHGWQPDMVPYYELSTVVVRLVLHDALGGTVREGLSFARHIIYSYSLPFSQKVSWGDTDGLITSLESLYEQKCAGTLCLNSVGRDYANEYFDEEKLTHNLISTILG